MAATASEVLQHEPKHIIIFIAKIYYRKMINVNDGLSLVLPYRRLYSFRDEFAMCLARAFEIVWSLSFRVGLVDVYFYHRYLAALLHAHTLARRRHGHCILLSNGRWNFIHRLIIIIFIIFSDTFCFVCLAHSLIHCVDSELRIMALRSLSPAMTAMTIVVDAF